MDSLLSKLIYGGKKTAAEDGTTHRDDSTGQLPERLQQQSRSRATKGGNDNNNNKSGEKSNPKRKRAPKKPKVKEENESDNDDDDEHSDDSSSSPPVEEWQKEVDATHQKAADLLNAVYGAPAGNANKTPASFANPFLVNSNRPPTRKPPKTRKRVNPWLRSRHEWEQAEYRDLTPEELELRALKQDRQQEWGEIRERWRKRKLDLRDEVDVGQAIARRARTALERQRALERQQQAQNTSSDVEDNKANDQEEQQQQQQEEEQEDEPDGPDLESSDEEHDQIYRRLMEPSQEDERKKAEKEAEKEKELQKELEQFRTPYYETMDYWELGRPAPLRRELPFLYQDAVPDQPVTSRHLGLNERTMGGSPSDGSATKEVSTTGEEDRQRQQLASLPTTGVILPRKYNDSHRRELPDRNAYFHITLHQRAYSRSIFLHRRQILRLAARFIIGTGGTEKYSESSTRRRLDNRLLRLLWQKGQDKASQLHLLLTITAQYGVNLETFLSRSWKNSRSRFLVGQHLGMYSSERDMIPAFLVGRTMEHIVVHKHCLLERRKMMRHAKIKESSSNLTLPPEVIVSEEAEESDELAGKRLIHPNSFYIYAQGTVPPVPSFPLDETGLVFGPSDLHTVFRHSGPIDEAIYKLTFSSLLSRWACFATNEDDEDSIDQNNKSGSNDLLNQLAVLLERAPLVARNDIVKRLSQRNAPVTELALVQFYRAIMGYASFAACGVAQKPPGNFELSLDNNAYEQLAWDAAATKIYDFSRTLIGLNGVKAFPRLQLVHGISLIARMLPSEAAEILSRPLDAENSRTPFDNFRSMLEYMEHQELLASDGDGTGGHRFNESTVSIGELEYNIHLASQVFARCIERDPAQMKYHAWYLGSLGACLLLCSGNRIGSGARAYPSSFAGACAKRDDFFGDESLLDQGGMVEKRKMLPKFEETRQRLRKAFGLFIHVTHAQKGNCRIYRAVSAFLEWRQVIALMVGRSCENPTQIREIRKCHQEHMIRWAHLERSTLAMMYLSGLVEADETVVSDEKLNHLATTIEFDPCNLGNWRALVRSLGPIGYIAAGKTEHTCEQTPCEECRCLRGDLCVDHTSLKSRKTSGQWWGTDRVSWWYPHFFYLHVQGTKPTPPNTFDKMVAAIERNLPRDSLAFEYFARPTELNAGIDTSPADLSWLLDGTEDIPRSDLDTEEAGDLSPRTSRSEFYDNALPTPLHEVLREQRNRSDSDSQGSHGMESSSVDSSAGQGSRHEIMFNKLVVSFHLFGLKYPSLKTTLTDLARCCFNKDFDLIQDCPEWRTLLRLHTFGVDILQVLTGGLKSNAVQAENPRPWLPQSKISEAEKTAIKDGVQLFGTGEWDKIMNHYKVFQKDMRAYNRAKYVYKFMVSKGEMEEARQDTVEETKKPRTRKIYGTPEVRNAVKRGIDLFGTRSWKRIQQSNRILRNLSYQDVRTVGQCLIRRGEVIPDAQKNQRAKVASPTSFAMI